MSILFDQDGFVSSLKDMANLVVPEVKHLRVVAVELPHPPGQVSLGGFDEKVVMIAHQTVSMTEPIKSFDNER